MEPRLVAIVRALSVQYVLMIFAVIPSATLSRNLDYKRLSLIEMAAALAASLTTLALALAGSGVWALVWGSLVAALCRTAALNFVAPFLAWPVFSFRGIGKLLFFGGNITAARILWFVYSQSDVIIAGRLLGKELLGFYAIAMNLASFPANKLSEIINQVSFPAFARIQGDRERYAASFLLAVRLLSFSVFPVLWGVSSIALELVSLLLGSHWLPAAVPLQLLALIMPLHMFAPFMNTAAQGIGRADIALKQVVLASLVMPLAFVVGSQWGLLGLAVAWVAAFPLVFVGAMALFLPVIGLRSRDFLGAMARPMLASLGMYATIGAARIMLGPVVSPVARMTLLIVVGVAVYAVLTLLLNRGGYREMRDMLRG
jgi:O-antigen/teichoic acid export membrane protein